MSKFASLALDVEQPQRMVLVHPITRQPLRNDAGEEAYIDLFSGDSDAARRHQRMVTRRRIALRGRGKMTPEELEAEQIELLSTLTAGWRLLGLDGSPLDVPFSPEAARELYGTASIAWIRDQVDEFANDRGNFSKASPKS